VMHLEHNKGLKKYWKTFSLIILHINTSFGSSRIMS